MTTPPQMQDLANRLVAYEAAVSKASEPVEFAAPRVYQKLRMRLSALAGVAGFQALAFRALAQAKADAPSSPPALVFRRGYVRALSISRIVYEIDRIVPGYKKRSGQSDTFEIS